MKGSRCAAVSICGTLLCVARIAAAQGESEPPPESPITAPVGRPAPPTEAATRATGPVRAGLEVFAQYSYRRTLDPDGTTQWFHVFDVPRVHGAVEGSYRWARGRVVIEGVRSAAEGSLIGVAGDSLVLRAREAYGAAEPLPGLEISAGVVPTLTVPALDGTWMMRPIAPSAVESMGLLSAADLGAKVTYELPRGYGRAGVGAYNGEGYTSRELNRGKNIEAAVEVHPAPGTMAAPLGVFGSWVSGSQGTLVSRADRGTLGLVWQDSWLRAGAFATHGWGVAQFGEQRTWAMSAFVRAEPVTNLLFAARADHVIRDASASAANAITTVWVAGGYRPLPPLEGFLALARSLPTRLARAEVPGVDFWELRVVTRVVF